MTEKKGGEDRSRDLSPKSGDDFSAIEDLLFDAKPPVSSRFDAAPQGDCTDYESMVRLFSRRIKAKERQILEEHLSRCDACRTLLAEIVRESPVPAQHTEGKPLTQPPSMDSILPGTDKTTRVLKLNLHGERRRRWRWAFAVAAPMATAACIFIMLSLTRPSVDMLVHLNRGHVVRSADEVLLKTGEVLRRGDRFRAEITARTDGFIYIYLAAGPEDSEFLFPSSSIPQDNQVRRGDRLLVPPQGSWVIDDSSGREETIFLLFSERPVASQEISRLSGELDKQGKTLSRVKKVLSQHFSIEQEISFQHQ